MILVHAHTPTLFDVFLTSPPVARVDASTAHRVSAA